MENAIVSKFGGSSVANSEQIHKVFKIVESNSDRKYIVVSAPGKAKGDAEKVTDHLFNIATDGSHFKSQRKSISAKESYDAVVSKFKIIIKDLQIDGTDILEDLKNDLKVELPEDKKSDFYASRGEHYNAKVINRYFKKMGLNSKCMLPEKIGFTVSENFGNAKVLPLSYKNIKQSLDIEGIAVIPGYYGITQKKDIAVLSRGGSDLTGGEIAYAITAATYENWTDTDGIYETDPRQIPEAKVIPELTYKEIRLLSSQGFNVFHYDAMINCKKTNIPINIRNTNNPDAPGTLIVAERVPQKTVVGIARLDDIAYLYLEKDMMNETMGFTNDLLHIFKDYGIMTYHYPTDKDDIAILVNQNDLMGVANDLKEDIEKELKPEIIDIHYNLSIISPVGIGMKDHPGVLAQAAGAFEDKNINIDIVVQGPAQISFHFGIQSYYKDEAMKALHNTFLING